MPLLGRPELTESRGMRTSLRFPAVVAAVVACGTPAAAPTTPVVATTSTRSTSSTSSTTASDAPVAEEPQASPTMPRPVLDIAPATLAWGGDQGPIMALDANGYLSISHDETAFLAVPFARLTARGELLRTDGTTLVSIDDAGTVFAEGRDLGFMIMRDGTAWQRGEKLHFAIAEDRTVSGTDPKTGNPTTHTDMQYVGPPATRRAIILAKITWAIWLTADEPEPVAPGKAKPTSIAGCDVYRTEASKALACVTRDKTWTKRLWIAIARVDGYAAELPPWGRDATASACSLGATRLKVYFATRKCAL